jgi:hypothetical protein
MHVRPWSWERGEQRTCDLVEVAGSLNPPDRSPSLASGPRFTRSCLSARALVSGSKIAIAVHADDGKIVEDTKVVRLVAFLQEHPLTVVTPSLKVVRIIRVLDETYSAIMYLNMVSTDDRCGSLTVSLAVNQHRYDPQALSTAFHSSDTRSVLTSFELSQKTTAAASVAPCDSPYTLQRSSYHLSSRRRRDGRRGAR